MVDGFGGDSYTGLDRLPPAILGRTLNGVEIAEQHKPEDWLGEVAEVVGGGVDVRVAPLLSWRIFEDDDVIRKYRGGMGHNPRIPTGIVLRF
jgi:hypothetical protein